MSELQIQYAKTGDGASVAFCVMGSGPPLVIMPSIPFNHIEETWRRPRMRISWERVSELRTVVRYDSRGTGLSSRDKLDFSLDAQIADLQAVTEKLGLSHFELQAIGNSVPAAIAYCARNPGIVTRLLLVNGWAAASRWTDYPPLRALSGLLGRDWETYTETYAHIVLGWDAAEDAKDLAILLRATMDEEGMRRWAAEVRSFDVSDLLPSVAVPTLVLHHRGQGMPPDEAASEIASALPNGRLVYVERGSAAAPLWGDKAMQQEIENWLTDGEHHSEFAALEQSAELPSGTAIILFADIVDSTALTERLGDSAFRTKARDLDGALRDVIREVDGTPVEGKLLGDGVLSVFTSAKNAIEAAMGFGTAAESVGLGLHVGIHAGDVIEEDGNVFGGAVNIAARVAAESAPGEVLVSQTVRELARTSAGVSFEDAGERALKGVGEPVRVWRVTEA